MAKSKRDKYLTIVYNTDGLTDDEVKELIYNPKASALSWCHAIDIKNKLLEELAEAGAVDLHLMRY